MFEMVFAHPCLSRKLGTDVNAPDFSFGARDATVI